MAIPALPKTWSANDILRASDLNADFTTIRDRYNSVTDGAVELSGTQTIAGAKTFSAIITGSAGATFGAALTVSAGGAAITGNSTITGTLGGVTVLTVATSGTINSVAIATAAGTNGKVPRYTAASVLAESGMSDNGTYTTNANQPRARLTASPITSVAGAITWAAAPLNVGTIWAVGNPTRMTIPANAGGGWQFSCVLDIKHNSTSASFSLSLRKNGTTTVATLPTIFPGSSAVAYTAVADEDAIASDYYEWILAAGDSANMTIGGVVANARKIW